MFLYFAKSSIPEICSFRKLEPGNGSKVAVTLLLVMLLVFICDYWSGEFFKLIGLSVDETQPIAETLKEASLTEIILIGFTTIIFAPIGAATPDWLAVILVYAAYLFIHALPYLVARLLRRGDDKIDAREVL